YVQSVGVRLVSSVAGKTMPLSPAPPSAAAVQRYPSESITPLAGRAARIIGPCAPVYRTDLIDGVIVTVPPVADVIFGSRSGSWLSASMNPKRPINVPCPISAGHASSAMTATPYV